MKKTGIISLYPSGKGLDKESVPGSQDIRALTEAKNIIINNRGSLKKFPGVRRLDYSADESDEIQGAVQFIATSGSAQRSEIVRVIGGRVEVLRDDQMVVIDEDNISPTDTVTFEKFGDSLILNFENTRPKVYTSGASSLTNLGVIPGHDIASPTFSRLHDFRLWYGGRGTQPHRLFVSVINNIEDYTLVNGGFSMRVYEGDGDPKGITGISPTFRGDIYAFKWNSIYRISRGQFGYRIDPLSNEVGCVHHNTMVAAQNDIFFVSPFGIHSLANTEKYGAIEEYTVSYPIFEWFQENVNWGASKSMIAAFDKPSNCYLLSYASAGSSINDKILGFNIKSREFFLREDIQYPIVTKYFDFGKQKTLIGSNGDGMGILDSNYTTEFGRAINCKIGTGILFPMKSPKTVVNFTKIWVLAKPTRDSVEFKLRYWINSDLIDEKTLNTQGEASTLQGTVAGEIGTAIIGTSIIGKDKEDIISIGEEIVGSGNSIQLEFEHSPPETDPGQKFEIYGAIIEFDYEEDTTEDTPI